MHAEFWWENLKERKHLVNLEADKGIILMWTVRKQDERMWTGFMWPNIGTSDRVL
jgi:hypothetical protein